MGGRKFTMFYAANGTLTATGAKRQTAMDAATLDHHGAAAESGTVTGVLRESQGVPAVRTCGLPATAVMRET